MNTWRGRNGRGGVGGWDLTTGHIRTRTFANESDNSQDFTFQKYSKYNPKYNPKTYYTIT